MTAKELGQQPAFPSEQTVYEPGHTFTLRDKIPTSGLTKREQFAMAAMQGILSANSTTLRGMKQENVDVDTIVAREAVRSADALLEELAKGTT